MRTIRRLIYGEVLSAVAYVTLGFLSLRLGGTPPQAIAWRTQSLMWPWSFPATSTNSPRLPC
jgi:hypothetical protein